MVVLEMSDGVIVECGTSHVQRKDGRDSNEPKESPPPRLPCVKKGVGIQVDSTWEQ